MILNVELIGRLIKEVRGPRSEPILIGTIAQILSASDSDDGKFRAVARMYAIPAIARLRGASIMQAVEFLASLSNPAAWYMLYAIDQEVCYGEMSAFHEFMQGATVGFLAGLAKTEGCSAQTQKDLGATLVEVMTRDVSTSVVCHECVGGISNAVSEISEKYPHFVASVLTELCCYPEGRLTGACTVRICNGFIHKILAHPALTFRQKATALSHLQAELTHLKQETPKATVTP